MFSLRPAQEPAAVPRSMTEKTLLFRALRHVRRGTYLDCATNTARWVTSISCGVKSDSEPLVLSFELDSLTDIKRYVLSHPLILCFFSYKCFLFATNVISAHCKPSNRREIQCGKWTCLMTPLCRCRWCLIHSHSHLPVPWHQPDPFTRQHLALFA